MNEANKPQIDLWNGRVGEKWAAMQATLDLMFTHATAALKAHAGSVAGLRLLDIGCGSGETCAAWLEGGAAVTGVDVSGPMLAVAVERTKGKATLLQADASEWKSDIAFDLAVSQFGLMFFADPVAAFTNLARNLRPGGRLLFSCWRPVEENAWVTVPMGAIQTLLPPAAPSNPFAPGPFALSDRQRLAGILASAGFSEIRIAPVDFPICMTREGGVEEACRVMMQIGPAAAALLDVSKEERMLAREQMKTALVVHEHAGEVNLGGAIWMVEAVRT